MAFEYNDELHSYALDGVALPSVSAILKATGYIDTRFIDRYPEATTRGTNTHKAIKYLLEGTLDESTVHESFKPRLDAFKLFLTETKFNVDLIGELNGKPVVIDTKTGSPAPWHGLQICAYEWMEREHDGIGRERFGLYLKKDGRYRLKEYAKLSDYVEFAEALETYNIMSKAG